jgi:hypothetical protein
VSATRRLAAILAGDVEGYSRLFGADERELPTGCDPSVVEVIDPKIAGLAVDRDHRKSSGVGYRVSQLGRSPRHDDRAGVAGFSPVRSIGGIRAQPDSRAHKAGPSCGAARGSHRRPTAETHRRQNRSRQGDARQSRYRREQIVHRLGVSPATLYRYIPAARTANPRRLIAEVS